MVNKRIAGILGLIRVVPPRLSVPFKKRGMDALAFFDFRNQEQTEVGKSFNKEEMKDGKRKISKSDYIQR